MRTARSVVVSVVVVAAATSCQDGSTVSPDGGSDAAALPPPTWSACSLATDGTTSDAECSQAQVPLDWSQPSGQQITYFVKRYRPPNVTTKADLWMIAGGPGAGGESFEAFAAALATAGHVDVYMPDHRGTGRSSRLTCAPAEQYGTPLDYAISVDEMKQCLSSAGPDAGSTLANFTPTNAARDIEWMVSQTRSPGRPVYVYGVSYGTYLTLRYLQLFPSGADGVVLDSLCSPGGCFLSRIDAWVNDAAKSFFAACGQDAFCGGKLGADPWAQLGAALDKLDANGCPAATAAGFTRAALKPILNELISLGGFDARPLAPVLAYRIMRCSTADAHALAKAGPKLFAPSPTSLPLSKHLDSSLLTDNIALSELYDSPPPALQTQQQIFAGTYVGSGRAVDLAELYDVWPRYPADPLAQAWPATTLPLLILRGDADYIPAAIAQEGATHFSGAHQQLVVMPRSQHDLLHNSATTTGPTCAQTLLSQFVTDPTANLDSSCIASIRDYGFTVAPAVATAVFGTTDAWEGDPGP